MKSIFHEISGFFFLRFVIFSIVFRDFFDHFVFRNIFQLSYASSVTSKIEKYDEKMTQIHFEFFVFFLTSSVYIHSQVFSFVFSGSFSGFFPSKRRVIQTYNHRDIKSKVSFIFVQKSEEKFENDEKYISHDLVKKMEQIKKSLNRFSKIVILKKKNVRKCFKKMKLVLKPKKNSKKTFVVFFAFSLFFQGIAEFSFKKKVFEFEKRSTKMIENFMINEIKIRNNELI